LAGPNAAAAAAAVPGQGIVYDGKRMRKGAIQRRTVDFQADILAFMDRYGYASHARHIFSDPSFLLNVRVV
jgi:hypothetical protein